MEKNTIKFYNLIFPFFIMMLIPPLTIVAIIGNLIIDAVVIISVLKFNKSYTLFDKSTIRITILKSFGLGFLADIIGMSVLIVIYGLFEPTINYFHIWDNPLSIIVHFIMIGLTGVIIFYFNKFLFKRLPISETTVFRVALSMAIITAPWTFLIPAALYAR